MVGARVASIIGTDWEISDLVTDRLYFTSVDLVRDGDRCVLDPDLAGAFTHVAARAADENAFLELIADAAKQLGLMVPRCRVDVRHRQLATPADTLGFLP
jgi:hypothetical protein